jgi:hypothetical protein
MTSEVRGGEGTDGHMHYGQREMNCLIPNIQLLSVAKHQWSHSNNCIRKDRRIICTFKVAKESIRYKGFYWCQYCLSYVQYEQLVDKLYTNKHTDFVTYGTIG